MKDNEYKAEIRSMMVVLIIDLALVAVVGMLAYYTTPWALLGLVFLIGWKTDTEVRVIEGSTEVVVTLSDSHDIDERTLRSSIKQAVAEAKQ